MKPTEIKDLVTGLLVIVMAAIALGQYGPRPEPWTDSPNSCVGSLAPVLVS
jgi:hypothetical protein